MENINNLLDLFLYQVKNLYAAETQIEKATTSFIEKVNHGSLKKALLHHASLTKQQKQRLADIPHLVKKKITGESVAEIGAMDDEFSCKGVAGLIDEINELLCSNLSDDVKDVAIIGSVQKIEHYEICAYGTALAFANQLHLHAVSELLNLTLQEEYDADDLLTALATSAINKGAVSDGIEIKEEKQEDNYIGVPDDSESPHADVGSERTINSPGGRAGTSHRRYGSGESRGH